jgi:GDPmannose 4,6-dehydratase
MPKKALITGCLGQDGSYLAELLLDKGYRVVGMDCMKPAACADDRRGILGHRRFEFLEGDLKDARRVGEMVRTVRPDELYNLAAQSYVPASWCDILDILDINAMGAARLLEAIRLHSPGTRFFQASSAEMFGRAARIIQDEGTCHHPRSPYGCSKSFAFNLTRNYREGFGVFACNGILYNHESPRRGLQFVTRKITAAAAKISLGNKDKVALGNLDAERDWGYAPDYVRAMWMMLWHGKADDYVVATGKMHSVRELAEKAFGAAGIRLAWKGRGLKEKGIDSRTGRVVVEVSREFFRPVDIERFRGNAGKIGRVLGWKPMVDFDKMIRIMVENDIESIRQSTIK